jgi:8-oxo-dGTP pyrophosphatase MutT (NUDIX family)
MGSFNLAPMNRDAILNLLSRHYPFDEVEAVFLEQTTAFVSQEADFASRLNPAGHLTGSAWVVNPAQDAVLLIHHVNLNRWLQPGGHVEDGDDCIQSTAVRETLEECDLAALELLSQDLFDLDVHPIPERMGIPAHLHYDFRFLVRVPDEAAFAAQEGEVTEVRWFSPAEILALHPDPSLVRMLTKLPGFPR